MKVIYHPNPLDSEGIGEIVQKEKVTMLFATPTFLQAYARKCSAEQFSSLRLVLSGAEKLRPAIASKFKEKFGITPIEGYGATELSPVVSINMPSHKKRIGQAIGREGSVGIPLAGVCVKIVDPESRERLNTGEEGLVIVKGPNVMPGYLNDPERTKEVIEDGWYNTGDLGYFDKDGYLYISGRLSRFSKIAGEMIPHGAVEEEINKVIESNDNQLIVTAVNDEKRGERLIVLYVDLPVQVNDIITKMRDTGLPNLWIPKAKDFYKIDEIPVLGTGKTDLKKVRDLAVENTQ